MRRLPLLLLVLLLPRLAHGAGELARSQAELEALAGRIESLVADVARDTSTADSITVDLDRLDRSKAALNRRIRENREAAIALDERLEQLRRDGEQLDDELASVRTGLAGLLRSRYMLQNVSPLRVLLDQQDPHAAARRLTMFRYVVDSGNRELAKLERLLAGVRENREQTAIGLRELAAVRRSLERDNQALADEEAAYRDRLASVRRKLSESEGRIALYREKEAALQKLVGELSRPRPDTAPRQGATAAGDNGVEPAAAGSSSAGAGNADDAAARKSPVAHLPGGFSRQKGRLALPLSSPLSARFGERREDSGLAWEGLLFESREGEPVHAVFPGQVVFSDWFRGYGQLMVVDHGEGYMSLYGHNRELRVGVGELVDAGQVIAMAAAAGEPPVPGTYFEIRHNGAPDDPLKWCR